MRRIHLNAFLLNERQHARSRLEEQRGRELLLLQKLVSPNLVCSLLNRVAYAMRERDTVTLTHAAFYKNRISLSKPSAAVASAASRECTSETSGGKFYGFFVIIFCHVACTLGRDFFIAFVTMRNKLCGGKERCRRLQLSRVSKDKNALFICEERVF